MAACFLFKYTYKFETMMSAVDAITRPAVPYHFHPYLEKHRILELFHEIAALLIINQPSDHILYMKQYLQRAVKNRDVPRIILITPPDFDKELLVEYLANKLEIHAITLADQKLSSLKTNVLTHKLHEILQDFHGWLLTDFPRDKLEARALQRTGILPTHVIEIAWTNASETYVFINSRDDRKNSSQHYDLQINGLREAYAGLLTTLVVGEKTNEELGQACEDLCRRQRHIVPCVYRILLLGAPGSGRKTTAKYLARRYGLIHADFEFLLHQQRDGGQESKKYFHIIENKLMSSTCVTNGWILTGYPITVEHFRLLDSLATPPNRVVFLDVDHKTRVERLSFWRFDSIIDRQLLSGSREHSTIDFEHAEHAKDVEEEFDEWQKIFRELLEYAGDSADVVNGLAEARVVQERVEACVIRPKIPFKPRGSEFIEKIDSRASIHTAE